VDTEAKEAAIIRRVYQGGYAHAENILLRLNELSATLSHAEAVDVLHHEVMESGTGEVVPDE
jgi:hypothetical protein